MTGGAVLVLNSVYQAIQVTGLRRAFRLFYSGRARAVDGEFRTYAFDHWCDMPHDPSAEIVRTPTRVVRVPQVIQLVRYDRLPLRDVRFSRRNVFYRDRNRCQYCRRVLPQRQLNLDHVVPLSRGGGSGWDNVVTACVRCNSRKGNRTPREADMRLLRQPRKPRANPILGTRWAQRGYREWATFLEAAHWNVELCEDVFPTPED